MLLYGQYDCLLTRHDGRVLATIERIPHNYLVSLSPHHSAPTRVLHTAHKHYPHKPHTLLLIMYYLSLLIIPRLNLLQYAVHNHLWDLVEYV